MAEGPGCLPCPEGWHTARVKCSSNGTRLQRSLGSSACRRWPVQAQWSSLEWRESTGNPVNVQHLAVIHDEHHQPGGKQGVL